MTRTTIRRRFLWVLKNTLNRVTARMARAGHGPFSLIRHVGRKSGRTYETPVILVHVREGFIAELTYGENVNWYRNIVAAGGCVVVHDRREYRVIHIEPCSAEYGRGAYAAPFRLVLKAAGRKEFRLLRTDKSQEPSNTGTQELKAPRHRSDAAP
jgi:deazaflavin-dependent oxidoreductase (nitroreductase family)